MSQQDCRSLRVAGASAFALTFFWALGPNGASGGPVFAQDAEHRGLPPDASQADEEIQTFYGHLMLPKEVDRANDIGQRFPRLAAKIDVLLSGQAEIRDEADRRRRLYQAQRARRDTTQGAEAQAGTSPPIACKDAEAGHHDLDGRAMTDEIAQATTARQGGRIEEACALYRDIRTREDRVRAAYDRCNLESDGIVTPLARQASFDFFLRTVAIRMQVLEKAQCR